MRVNLPYYFWLRNVSIQNMNCFTSIPALDVACLALFETNTSLASILFYFPKHENNTLLPFVMSKIHFVLYYLHYLQLDLFLPMHFDSEHQLFFNLSNYTFKNVLDQHYPIHIVSYILLLPSQIISHFGK